MRNNDEVTMMKELYTAPEAKLTGFVSAEELAASIDFDDLLAGTSGGTAAGRKSGDIDLDF